jgi:hypothetical protein
VKRLAVGVGASFLAKYLHHFRGWSVICVTTEAKITPGIRLFEESNREK